MTRGGGERMIPERGIDSIDAIHVQYRGARRPENRKGSLAATTRDERESVITVREAMPKRDEFDRCIGASDERATRPKCTVGDENLKRGARRGLSHDRVSGGEHPRPGRRCKVGSNVSRSTAGTTNRSATQHAPPADRDAAQRTRIKGSRILHPQRQPAT